MGIWHGYIISTNHDVSVRFSSKRHQSSSLKQRQEIELTYFLPVPEAEVQFWRQRNLSVVCIELFS